MSFKNCISGSRQGLCPMTTLAPIIKKSIDFSMLPLSASAQREIEANPTNKGILLNGGDDYEIILCCSPENSGEIISKAAEQGVTVTEIGRVTNQGDRPVRVTEGGCLVELEDISWRHF